EELVEHQETASRRIISHCRLEWDDRCLSFEKNSSPVATASAVQVRAPLYRSSIDRWRRYEKQLEPLGELLRTAGIEVPTGTRTVSSWRLHFRDGDHDLRHYTLTKL